MITITVVFEGPNDFTVRVNDIYVDNLTWEEMIGQIVTLTHPDIKKVRFKMRTKEETDRYYAKLGITPLSPDEI